MEIQLVVYRTPVRPGACYVFYNSIKRSSSPGVTAQLAANRRPTFQAHMEMLHFFVGGSIAVVMPRRSSAVQHDGYRVLIAA